MLNTSMASRKLLSKFDGQPFGDPSGFRELVGFLQNLTLTRLDIYFSVNKLCQFMKTLTDVHQLAAKRLLCYLKGTLHFSLVFAKPSILELVCYCYTNWRSNLDDKKSISAYYVYFDNCLIFW